MRCRSRTWWPPQRTPGAVHQGHVHPTRPRRPTGRGWERERRGAREGECQENGRQCARVPFGQTSRANTSSLTREEALASVATLQPNMMATRTHPSPSCDTTDAFSLASQISASRRSSPETTHTPSRSHPEALTPRPQRGGTRPCTRPAQIMSMQWRDFIPVAKRLRA